MYDLKIPKPSKYVGLVKLDGIQSTHCVVWHSSQTDAFVIVVVVTRGN